MNFKRAIKGIKEGFSIKEIIMKNYIWEFICCSYLKIIGRFW